MDECRTRLGNAGRSSRSNQGMHAEKRPDTPPYLSQSFVTTESLCKLTYRNEPALDHNNLTNLPLALNKLRNLQRVDVSHNKTAVFAGNLLALPSLRSLKESNNQITDFPIALGTVSTLQNIQLGGNRIETIPDEMFDLNAGLIMFIHDNPILETDVFVISTRQKRISYQGPAIF